VRLSQNILPVYPSKPYQGHKATADDTKYLFRFLEDVKGVDMRPYQEAFSRIVGDRAGLLKMAMWDEEELKEVLEEALPDMPLMMRFQLRKKIMGL
jgi:elongation factor P--beta-lysine ligase